MVIVLMMMTMAMTMMMTLLAFAQFAYRERANPSAVSGSSQLPAKACPVVVIVLASLFICVNLC